MAIHAQTAPGTRVRRVRDGSEGTVVRVAPATDDYPHAVAYVSLDVADATVGVWGGWLAAWDYAPEETAEHLAAFTLQDEWQDGGPVAVGTWDGTTWNGSPVPTLSAYGVRRYWEEMAAWDRHGTWHDTIPFVAADGTLHLPAHDAPEDRDEDMTWHPREDGRYAVDGLCWTVLGDDGREG